MPIKQLKFDCIHTWIIRYHSERGWTKSETSSPHIRGINMKSILSALSISLLVSFTGSVVHAYSGSECEVNDCSGNQPAKASSKVSKDKSKTETRSNSETKAKPAAPKDQAQDTLKDKVPSPLQGLTGFLK